ncbi:hypothetical protein AX16_002437 [Volvariella volvacea WC 439]|nr:hypothetical protein AX16_002437 [Volvariella volvacea WC 439]
MPPKKGKEKAKEAKLRVCKYVNSPGGCKRLGSGCPFYHPTPTGATSGAGTSKPVSSTSGHGASTPRPGPSNRQARRQPSAPTNLNATRNENKAPTVPHGVCNSFWSTGQCSEKACALRHTRPLGAFTTGSALAKSPETIFQSSSNLKAAKLSPAEVNAHLSRFLKDDFRFRKTADVYGFVELLSIANTQSSSWTPEDGQLLLGKVSEGNGLLRIVDVIAWESVSATAGRGEATLSFQRAYIPLMKFFASEVVAKTTMIHQANMLYTALIDNFEQFRTNLQASMTSAMSRRSFKDETAPAQNDSMSAMQVFMSLTIILYECLSRFKNLSVEKPIVTTTVQALRGWIETFVSQVKASSTAFDGAFKGMKPNQRDHFLEHLQGKLERLIRVAERESKKAFNVKERPNMRVVKGSSDEGLIAHLNLVFEGPGSLRPSGPMHNNDNEDIHNISIAPTCEELLCDIAPYLPANFDGAPHHLPQRTMERHLDIQFRLLREELTAPLRIAIQLVHTDLQNLSGRTKLADIFKKKGGKYTGNLDVQGDIMFNVYTGVDFRFITAERGINIELFCDTPSGNARSQNSKVREAFWEKMSGKRLMNGGLIALVWQSGSSVSVELGTITSTMDDLKKSAKYGANRVLLKISFFNPEFELRVLKHLHYEPNTTVPQKILLVESPVMYESIRPFLEALRVQPESIALGNHIVKPFDDVKNTVPAPRYARSPGFSYRLDGLFPHEAGIKNLTLNVLDSHSVRRARKALEKSRLDESQASAVVDALSREVALIQGPPGTGKSYTGVELLRVLLPVAKPILMIAFTNHALDHMLNSVLDARITNDIIRLGGRSADERISQFSLENLETQAGKSRLNRSFAHYHRELRDVEVKIKRFMKKISSPIFSGQDILNHIRDTYRKHYDGILHPPPLVQALKEFEIKEEKGGDLQFLHTERKLKTQQATVHSTPHNDEQHAGNQFLLLPGIVDEDDSLSPDDASDDASDDVSGHQSENESEDALDGGFDDASEEGVDEDLPPTAADYLREVYSFDELPDIPTGNRPLEDLLNDDLVWEMSFQERGRLHKYWTDKMKEIEQPRRLQEYSALRETYRKLFALRQQGRDEARRQLLLNIDIIECTTTGAAKLTSLLKGLEPKILLVEEAGQVLEAHILGSLVSSVEHMILIGDPFQLRPTLNNYSLSMDSRAGKRLYRFDMSLMERLSSSGFPMSRIDVQRRMRPEISSLIRQNYPNVRGMVQNVFFLDHQNTENGDHDDTASKYNTYEVETIKDLVMYLLKQGYSQDGDIVVLCAYLGQLARVRDALSQEVVVVIDDRDMQELASYEDEKEKDFEPQPNISHVKASKQVRIRTVDNYQGEEAKIVILPLVRNAGSQGGRKQTIGFLKSTSRTNIALSRAKEGLYILGNAEQMRSSSSEMWRGVVDQFANENLIGDAIPVVCDRHPDTINYINKPGMLRKLAPDGSARTMNVQYPAARYALEFLVIDGVGKNWNVVTHAHQFVETAAIVDFVTQRILGDVAKVSQRDRDILITLPRCLHVFTMRTLDDHCGISDWYIRRESDGKWIDLQTLEGNKLGSRKPPVCPTCGAAITSPRYGRIFKAANLQILEHNSILLMAQQLKKLCNTVNSLSTETKAAQIRDAIKRIDFSAAQELAQKSVLASTHRGPILSEHIIPDNKELFAISPNIAAVWNRLMKPITQAYESIVEIANTRPAHIQAWEAAYKCLFDREVELATRYPSRSTGNPREHGLCVAQVKVGLPRPCADQYYLVEALWLSIFIRFTLSDLALALLEAMDRKENELPILEREGIGDFGAFILSSCQDDARRAYEVAQASSARRQMTTSTLIRILADLKAFQFELGLSRALETYQETRKRLSLRAAQYAADTAGKISETIQEHRTARPEDVQDWLSSNFYGIATLIKKEWEKIIKSLNEDKFYEPVSFEKFAMLNSSGIGNFYMCPNGHVSVVGERGRAMHASRCSECGATIGGSNHAPTRESGCAGESKVSA